jgi:hypothetical protein
VIRINFCGDVSLFVSKNITKYWGVLRMVKPMLNFCGIEIDVNMEVKNVKIDNPEKGGGGGLSF